MWTPPFAVEGELRLSGSDCQRCCLLGATIGGSATIPREMVSDYRATIERLSQSESRAEVFPNFPKTFQKPDQNFFKTVRKIERFFCAAGEGLSRAHGLGSGRLSRLGDGRQPPRGGRDLPPAVIRGQRSGCAACGAGSRRRAAVIRGQRSGCAAGLRVWQSGGLPLLPCCCCGQSLQCRCEACTRPLWRFCGVG